MQGYKYMCPWRNHWDNQANEMSPHLALDWWIGEATQTILNPELLWGPLLSQAQHPNTNTSEPWNNFWLSELIKEPHPWPLSSGTRIGPDNLILQDSAWKWQVTMDVVAQASVSELWLLRLPSCVTPCAHIHLAHCNTGLRRRLPMLWTYNYK
jgi:hypothetical protein